MKAKIVLPCSTSRSIKSHELRFCQIALHSLPTYTQCRHMTYAHVSYAHMPGRQTPIVLGWFTLQSCGSNPKNHPKSTVESVSRLSKLVISSASTSEHQLIELTSSSSLMFPPQPASSNQPGYTVPFLYNFG